MAIDVMNLCWYVEGLTPAQKVVLVALADHAHNDGSEARPGVELLTIKTSLGDRTVRRALKALRGLGIVKVQRESTRYLPTVYKIDLPLCQVWQNKTCRSVLSDLPESPPDLPESPVRPAALAGKPSLNHQEPSLNRESLEIEQTRAEYVSVISQVTSGTVWVKTQKDYDDAADNLIQEGISIEQILSFQGWWLANTFYKDNSQARLVTFMSKIGDSIAGVSKQAVNGQGQPVSKEAAAVAWSQLWTGDGWKAPQDSRGKATVKAMGGMPRFKNSQARERSFLEKEFKSAY